MLGVSSLQRLIRAPSVSRRRIRSAAAFACSTGTKGGRLREAHPANVDRAFKSVQRAQAIVEATGQPYLLVRADGAVTTGLKQALKMYSNICYRAGIQSHGARYAFARERSRLTVIKATASARRAPRHSGTWDTATAAGATLLAFRRAAREIHEKAPAERHRGRN